MSNSAELEQAARRRVLDAILKGAAAPGDDLAAITTLYVSSGHLADGGLLLRCLQIACTAHGGKGALHAAHRILASTASPATKAALDARRSVRSAYIRQEVQRQLTQCRRQPGVEALLLLMAADRMIRNRAPKSASPDRSGAGALLTSGMGGPPMSSAESHGPSVRAGATSATAPWCDLALDLALGELASANKHFDGPEWRWPGLRRDAFALAALAPASRGRERNLAGKILDEVSWPRRARAALIRRLWQCSRSAWRTHA